MNGLGVSFFSSLLQNKTTSKSRTAQTGLSAYLDVPEKGQGQKDSNERKKKKKGPLWEKFHFSSQDLREMSNKVTSRAGRGTQWLRTHTTGEYQNSGWTGSGGSYRPCRVMSFPLGLPGFDV